MSSKSESCEGECRFTIAAKCSFKSCELKERMRPDGKIGKLLQPDTLIESVVRVRL